MKRYLYGEAVLAKLRLPGIRDLILDDRAYIPDEYVVFSPVNLYRPEHSALHTCKIKGAQFFTQGNRCTLPLVFLQLSKRYDLRKLVLLGLLLCAHWDGKAPLCTPEELKLCAETLVGHRGRRKALRALCYVREGCRSPQEALLYILLRLPMCHGGCGFVNLVFDHKIYCEKAGKTYYADLYEPRQKLIIEYDSRQYHNNDKAFSEDAIRRENLIAAGYKVVSIRPEQINDPRNFETVIQNMARIIKKRLCVRARKYFENFALIQDLIRKRRDERSSQHRIVALNEVPKLSNARRMYALYLEASRRRFFYPEQRLQLSG